MAVENFGNNLKTARERRGMTLLEISEATKISPASLKCLENNEIENIPSGIFLRGFIRAYADTVGLDPEGTVKDFCEAFPSASMPLYFDQSEDFQEFTSQRRIARTVAAFVALSIPVAGLLIVLGLAGNDVDMESDEPETRIEQVSPLVDRLPSR
tara:strand:- start:473 stop:937 length:465 start_codon:yes stop_codon:yes gene_type:complete